MTNEATTIPEAAQRVWNFTGIGDGMEVDFNGAYWVAEVNSAVRCARLRRANSMEDWKGDQEHTAARAANWIIQTWLPSEWDKNSGLWYEYSGPRGALINILGFAAYTDDKEYDHMVMEVFGKDVFYAAYSTLEQRKAQRARLAAADFVLYVAQV